jgi:hypothetical protein
MNLLAELAKSRHLKWGDPERPEDEDSVMYLCALADDEIVRLREKLENSIGNELVLAEALGGAEAKVVELEIMVGQRKWDLIAGALEWAIHPHTHSHDIAEKIEQCRNAAIDDAKED